MFVHTIAVAITMYTQVLSGSLVVQYFIHDMHLVGRSKTTLYDSYLYGKERAGFFEFRKQI